MRDEDRVNDWEKVDENTERLKIPSGWIVHRKDPMSAFVRGNDSLGAPMQSKDVRYPVKNYTVQIATSMVYVPDVNHKWKL